MVYGNRGTIIRIIYLFVSIIFSIIHRINKTYTRNDIITLCYHGVKDHQRINFERQMMTAWEHGYLSNKIQHGNLKLMPPPSVMVTFDDAFSNLSRNVIPIISKLNIPITIFVPTGSVGQQPSWLNDIAHSDSNEKVMSSSQLYLLKENPLVTLGSHTVSHPRLTQIHGEKLNYELCTSINYLRGITHKEISDLAFPHGDYNDNVIKMAKEAGYKKVYTLDPVVYSANDNNDTLQLIGRFSMSPDIWPIEFYLTINGAYAWLHTWRSFIKKFTTN